MGAPSPRPWRHPGPQPGEGGRSVSPRLNFPAHGGPASGDPQPTAPIPQLAVCPGPALRVWESQERAQPAPPPPSPPTPLLRCCSLHLECSLMDFARPKSCQLSSPGSMPPGSASPQASRIWEPLCGVPPCSYAAICPVGVKKASLWCSNLSCVALDKWSNLLGLLGRMSGFLFYSLEKGANDSTYLTWLL